MSELSTFFPNWSLATDRRRVVDQAAARSPVSSELASLLEEMNRGIPPSEARTRHLAELSQKGTVAVITGQQTGLLMGPALTFYKIISAIKIARQIREEFDVPAVPVFWVQGEDHDFDEINAVVFPSRGGEIRKLALPPLPENRRSVSSVALPAEISLLVDEFTREFESFPGFERVNDVLRAAYVPGATVENAFARTVAGLFAEDGLLLFRPRFPGAAKLLAPVFRRAYSEHEAITSHLLRQKEQGVSQQVHVRPHSPLFFFHPHGSDGPRFRVERALETWRLVGADEHVAPAEIEHALESEPSRFSASALLRPLIQDSLFPTAAYVGGEAELAYFQQIAPLFEHFGLPRPAVVPRGHFLILEPKAVRLSSDLNLAPSRVVAAKREVLLEELLSQAVPTDIAPKNLKARANASLREAFAPLRAAINTVDVTLLSPLEKTEERFTQQIDSLLERYARALEQKEQVTANRLDALRGLVYPQEQPQERIVAGLYYLARYDEPFRELVTERFIPGSTELIEIEL